VSVHEAQGRVDTAEAQASSFLVASYMEAGSTQAVLASGSADLNSTLNQKMLLDTLRGDRQQLTDDLTASKADLQDRQAELEAQQAELAKAEADSKAAKDQLAQSVDKERQLYNQANDELKQALAEEQRRRDEEAARKAAEEQARVEAKAKADAQAKAQAQAQAQAKAQAAAVAPRAAAPAAAAPKVAAPKSTPTNPSTTATDGGGAAGDTGGGSTVASPPPPPVAVPSSSRGAAALAAAQSQLGKPYVYGAAGPNSFDCSGLVMWAYGQVGVSLPHYTGAQYSATARIPISDLQPGDLVFFYSDLHHVGIYAGGGMMIHAPHTGDVVKYDSIYRMGAPPVGAGRIR
jgi:cell wall-associated NlpC family hydrolase